MASHMNMQRSHFQPLPNLTCTKHNEPVKGVCLFPGNCYGRLLCRTCRRLHDNNHLNHYEEFEDTFNGNLVEDTLKGFRAMLEEIDAHNAMTGQNCQVLLGQVDGLFKQIQDYMIQKLNNSRVLICNEIKKRFRNNNPLKQEIINSINTLEKTFNHAKNNAFRPFELIENVIHALVEAQNKKDVLNNDPNLNSKQTEELSLRYMETLGSGRLFHSAKFSLDKICQDLIENFNVQGNLSDLSLYMTSNLQFDPIPLDHFKTSANKMNLESSSSPLFPEIKAPLLTTPLSQINLNTNKSSAVSTPYRNNYLSQSQPLRTLDDPAPQKKSPFGREPSYLSLNNPPQLFHSSSGASESNQPIQMSFGMNRIEPLDMPADMAPPDVSQLSLRVPQNSMIGSSMFLGTPQSNMNVKLQEVVDTLVNFNASDRSSRDLGGKSPLDFQQIVISEDVMEVVDSGSPSEIANMQGRNFEGDTRELEGGKKSKGRINTANEVIEIFRRAGQEEEKAISDEIQKVPSKGSVPQGKQYDPFSPNPQGNRPPPPPQQQQTQPQPQAQPQREPEQRREPIQRMDSMGSRGADDKLLLAAGNMPTSHKQILPGGMAYVNSRAQLITAGSEGTICVWDLNTRGRLKEIKAHNGEIYQILYIQEKDMIVSCSSDGVAARDCNTQYKHVHTYNKHEGPVYAIEYLSDLRLIASGGQDQKVHLWSLETLKESEPIKNSFQVSSLCYLRRARKIAIGSDKGIINVVSLENEQRKSVFFTQAHQGAIVGMKYLEDQALLVTASEDGSIKVWKIEGDKVIQKMEFRVEGKKVRSFIVRFEDDLLLSNHEDNVMRMWKLTAQQKFAEKQDETFGGGMVELTGRKKPMIMTAESGKCKLWNLNV